ncbi:MAG: hypothetical protein J0M24_13810 [Verrucomicrobia bacterium]|nr:hypothetical protein [Verrucomicrobiota bacterium]
MTARRPFSQLSALSSQLLWILLASQLSALSSQLLGAELYGQFLNANSTPYTNEVLFRALSTPLNAHPRIIAGGDFRVTPNTNGDFTINLQAGDYRVFSRLDSRGFVISVPDGTNSYLINSRITSALTYTPAAMVLGNATNVPKAAVGTSGLVKTDSSTNDPVVYLKTTVDTLLAGKVSAIDVRNYGAKGDGTTDETTSFTSALAFASASPSKELRVPAGVFKVSRFTVPAGVTLSLDRDATIYASTWLADQPNERDYTSVIELGDGAKIQGGKFDLGLGRLSAPSGNDNYFYGISAFGKTNVVVDGVRFVNSWHHPIFMRYTTNAVVRNCSTFGGGQGPGFFHNRNLTINDLAVEEMDSNTAGIGQVAFTAAYNHGTKVNGLRVINPKSGTNAPSYAVSGALICGEMYSSFSQLMFDRMTSSVDFGMALLIDGGEGIVVDNATVYGWNVGSAIAIEISGTRGVTLSNINCDGTRYPNATGNGGSGILIHSWGIYSSDSGGYVWSGPWQERSRSTAAETLLSNVRVTGYRDGIRVGASKIRVVNSVFNGNSQYGIRLQNVLAGGDIFTVNPVIDQPNDNWFIGCEAKFNGLNGVALSGGDRNYFVDCDLGNNNQLQLTYGAVGSHSQAVGTASGSTSTTVTTSTTFTANQWKNFFLYFPATGDTRLITAHTTNSFTVTPAWSVNPTSGQFFSIVGGPTGDVVFRNSSMRDTQTEELTGEFSLDPTQTFASASDQFIVSCRHAQSLSVNQLVNLQGVLSGGSNLLVRVQKFHETDPDSIYVTAVSPTSGAFNTNSPVVTAGTGTVSWTAGANPYDLQDQLIITGTGTVFGVEADAHWWIKVGSEWRRILHTQSDTRLAVSTPFSANFSNQPFSIYRFTGNLVPTQAYAMNFLRFDGKIHLQGVTETDGNLTGTYSSADSPDAPIPRLAVNSTYPAIGIGEVYRLANTAATLITNFSGGFEGRSVRLIANDTNTTIAFTASSIYGPTTENYLLSNRDIVDLCYTGGRWVANVRSANLVSLFAKKSGDTFTGPMVVTQESGAAGYTLRRTSGGTPIAEFSINLGNTRPNILGTQGRLTFTDSGTDAVNKPFGIGPLSYNIANAPFYGYGAQTTSTANALWLGGGTSASVAATQISFFGATNNTTLNGSEVGRIVMPTIAGRTSLFLYDVDNATLEPVTVGAADSGGTGFKVLRIPN